MGMTLGQRVTVRDLKGRTKYDIVRDVVPTKILIADSAPWEWALIQRHVSGWNCIAVGSMREAVDADDVAYTIREQYADGFDRLPRERFVTVREGGEIICISRTDGSGTYCGGNARVPYVPCRRQQHHIECTDAYRAEHYGRCPVED